MKKLCPICDIPFKDDDKLIAVVISTYKQLDTEMLYAITTPTDCLEIMHFECYDPAPHDDTPQVGGTN